MSSMLLKANRNKPPEKAELPPRHASGAFSSTNTFAPWSRAASDAQSAALPQPTTDDIVFLFSIRHFSKPPRGLLFKATRICTNVGISHFHGGFSIKTESVENWLLTSILAEPGQKLLVRVLLTPSRYLKQRGTIHYLFG